MKLPEPAVPPDPLSEELSEVVDRLGLAARAAELDAAPAFPRGEFRELGTAGWLGLTIPARWGGRGLPVRRAGRLLGDLARRTGTTFAKLALQPEFCSVLADHGPEPLAETWFRPLVAGERLVGNHVTEPGAGSDAAAIQAQARPSTDGYELTGEKSEVAFAEDADAAIVYAREDAASGEAGFSAFLVPQTLPGIARRTVVDMGERWMRRGSVRYERVRLAAGSRIGEPGRAFGYLRRELMRERALLGAIYLGVARGCWEATVEHVGGRVAFGQPLSRQEGVAFPLVEDWARIDAASLYVDTVLGRLDAGEAPDGPAALAKWSATEVALTAIDHAIQFHGGRGYSRALPFEQRWRDVRSGALGHGPSEIMRVVAGRSLWGKERTATTPTAAPPTTAAPHRKRTET